MTARVATRAMRVLLAAMLSAAPLQAQVEGSLFERLNLDRLRLTALGGGIGPVRLTRLEATTAYSLFSDYGEIAPRWRVVFGATYWKSEYKRKYLEEFADSIENSVDPDSATLTIGRVTMSDIALSADLRWAPFRGSTALRPYVGGSAAAHVLNAEGRPISGTFVESALDNITAGIGGVAGVDLLIFDRLLIGAQARYDLLTGARFASARVLVGYLFAAPQRQDRPQ